MEQKEPAKLLLSFLKLKIPFSKTGKSLAYWEAKIREGILERPFTLSEIIKGFNAVLLKKISGKEFERWSDLVYRSLIYFAPLYPNLHRIANLWEDMDDAVEDTFLTSKERLEEVAITRAALELHHLDFHLQDEAMLDREITIFEDQKEHTSDELERFFTALLHLGEAGDYCAYYYLGSLYYAGKYVKQDFALAKQYSEKAASMGSAGALINLGYIDYYARLGGKPDYEAAFHHFEMASIIGSPTEQIKAKYKLSDFYANGYFVKKDPKVAYQMVDDLYGEALFDNDPEVLMLLGDLAFRLGKAHTKNGPVPSLEEALHYYLQAQELIEKRWDGVWFGDKELLHSCQKAIKPLLQQRFGGVFPRQQMSLTAEDCFRYGDDIAPYDLESVIYDAKKKELYLYLRTTEFHTIDEIPFTGRNYRTCFVLSASSAHLFVSNFDNIEPYYINCSLTPLRTKEKGVVEGFITAEEIDADEEERTEIATFRQEGPFYGYVAYIQDFRGHYLYADPRYVLPENYERKPALLFTINSDDICFWSLNQEAKDRYGRYASLDELPFSASLKSDIKEALQVYRETDMENAPEGTMDRWRRDVMEPLYRMIEAEIGASYRIVLEGKDPKRSDA